MKAKELAEMLLQYPEAELIFVTDEEDFYDDPILTGPIEDDNPEERESARFNGRPVRELLYVGLN